MWDPPSLFSLPSPLSSYRGPGGILRVSSCPHHICREPSNSKRWNMKLKTMLKKPLYFWGPRQFLLFSMIQLPKKFIFAIRAWLKYIREFYFKQFIRCIIHDLINPGINGDEFVERKTSAASSISDKVDVHELWNLIRSPVRDSHACQLMGHGLWVNSEQACVCARIVSLSYVSASVVGLTCLKGWRVVP